MSSRLSDYCEMTDSDTPGLHVNFSDKLQKLFLTILPPSLY